jgi:FKBP-type peptidyl-prolyl cis-trans isomerase 2
MTKGTANKPKRKTKPPLAEGSGEGPVVGENTVVTLSFVVWDEEGHVLDDMYERTPFKFVFGQGDLPPGLEEGIAGLTAGQSKRLVVPPARAYGERNKDLVIRIPRAQLPSDECVVGTRYRRLNADGESELFTVMGYLEDWVYLDRNHPWAGKHLVYEVRIVEVLPLYMPVYAGQDPREG